MDRTDPSLCLALLPVGFAEPMSHPIAGALLPHRFTLTLHREVQGGLLSVALSLALRPVGVTHHRVL